MATLKDVSLSAALVMALFAYPAATPGWSQTARTATEIAKAEALLRDRSVLLLPRFLLMDRPDLASVAAFDHEIFAVTKGAILETLVRQLAAETQLSLSMRDILLFDRAYRALLAQEYGLPVIPPSADATTPAAVTTTPDAGGTLPADLSEADLANAWSGGLDPAELNDIFQRFQARPGRHLETYSATPMTLVIDPSSGTVRIAGQAVCEVQTRSDTSNGRDFSRTRTVTSYETDGAQPLHANAFEVRVRIQRWVENSKGPVGVPGDTVTIHIAKLSAPDENGMRRLQIYNGQPSVPEAAWLLVARDR